MSIPCWSDELEAEVRGSSPDNTGWLVGWLNGGWRKAGGGRTGRGPVVVEMYGWFPTMKRNQVSRGLGEEKLYAGLNLASKSWEGRRCVLGPGCTTRRRE